jgi:hypothetical protein
MLSILALILVILALTGEMAKEGTFKNEKVEAAVHFGKAHALNIAVAIDIFVAENKDAVEGVRQATHIPVWAIIAATALIAASYLLKKGRNRKLARLGAAGIIIAETAETL